jgi:hypothetical protein
VILGCVVFVFIALQSRLSGDSRATCEWLEMPLFIGSEDVVRFSGNIFGGKKATKKSPNEMRRFCPVKRSRAEAVRQVEMTQRPSAARSVMP